MLVRIALSHMRSTAIVAVLRRDNGIRDGEEKRHDETSVDRAEHRKVLWADMDDDTADDNDYVGSEASTSTPARGELMKKAEEMGHALRSNRIQPNGSEEDPATKIETPTFQIFVKTILGNTLVIAGAPDMGVAQIIDEIALITLIPCSTFYCTFQGKILGSGGTLEDMGIGSNSTLFMTSSLRGGGPQKVIKVTKKRESQLAQAGRPR